jgi:hypothetical protein
MNPRSRRAPILLICIAAVAALSGACTRTSDRVSGGGEQSVIAAVRDHARHVQVEGQGTVVKLLPDDLEGERHQRILLRLGNGGTLLIAHNIDLASRVEGLREGDTIQFYGEFEWNDKGGVVHWTHHDPQRRHLDGWIKFEGRTYQ